VKPRGMKWVKSRRMKWVESRGMKCVESRGMKGWIHGATPGLVAFHFITILWFVFDIVFTLFL
jgi:hypothetical protein